MSVQIEIPTVDELLGKGHFWDGDKAKAPNGHNYWRFMLFKYNDKCTYVLENHWHPRVAGGWGLEQVVKKLW